MWISHVGEQPRNQPNVEMDPDLKTPICNALFVADAGRPAASVIAFRRMEQAARTLCKIAREALEGWSQRMDSTRSSDLTEEEREIEEHIRDLRELVEANDVVVWGEIIPPPLPLNYSDWIVLGRGGRFVVPADGEPFDAISYTPALGWKRGEWEGLAPNRVFAVASDSPVLSLQRNGLIVDKLPKEFLPARQ